MIKLNLYPLVAITLATTPVVALAQTPQPPSSPPSPAQQIQQQQARIKQIEAEAQTQIEAVLTPEQQNQYRRVRRRGAGLIQGLDTVQNLTEEQLTEINAITRKTTRRLLDLLPPARRQR